MACVIDFESTVGFDLLQTDIFYASIKCLDSEYSCHLQVCAIHWYCHHPHERLPQVQSKFVDPVPTDEFCWALKL